MPHKYSCSGSNPLSAIMFDRNNLPTGKIFHGLIEYDSDVEITRENHTKKIVLHWLNYDKETDSFRCDICNKTEKANINSAEDYYWHTRSFFIRHKRCKREKAYNGWTNTAG